MPPRRIRRNRQPRALWLRIRAKTPPGITQDQVTKTLLESIQRKDYRYPSDWYVNIMWRNKADAPMKSGEFTHEMTLSAASSPGWDNIVYRYLSSK